MARKVRLGSWWIAAALILVYSVVSGAQMLARGTGSVTSYLVLGAVIFGALGAMCYLWWRGTHLGSEGQ